MSKKPSPKLKWFHGAICLKGSKQQAAVIVAESAKEALEMLNEVCGGLRSGPRYFRNYWNKAEPREYANLNASISKGVYASKDMNWDREYVFVGPTE